MLLGTRYPRRLPLSHGRSPQPLPEAVFAPGRALCPGGHPVRCFPAPRTRCPPFPHGRNLCTVPGPRRRLFLRRVCPLSWRAARAVTSRHQTPPIARCFPVGAACAQSPVSAGGCFCAQACSLPRRAPSVMLPGTRHLPLPLSHGRSLRTVPDPARGCFCAWACPLSWRAPSVMLPGTRHPIACHSPMGCKSPNPPARGCFCALVRAAFARQTRLPVTERPCDENCSRTGDRLPHRRSFFRGGGIGW